MAAIRAGQGLLVGLLRCGHCGRKLHVRYWGGTGTNARYLWKGDYDDGGQYCIGFGGALVDRRLGDELLKMTGRFFRIHLNLSNQRQSCLQQIRLNGWWKPYRPVRWKIRIKTS